MIQHVVLLTFVPEATPEQVAAVIDGLQALPELIPQIKRYAVGPDLGLAADTASFGIVAEFETRADYEAYRDHPAHQQVIAEHIAPIRVARAAIQFEH
ncbi:MAG: Dabb family protein [Acidimicrobiia bacterium]